jgi:hypothetical protein
MKKRIVGLALCFALVASMMLPAFAYAGNTTPYGFYFTFNGNLAQTDSEYKATSSSVRMAADYVTTGKTYIASVQARANGNSMVDIPVDGEAYTFSNGTIRNNMINYVNERGYQYAGIRAAQYYSDPTFIAYGTWRPDAW